MNKPSTSTAKDPEAVESAEPSLKKQRLSTEPLTLEEEFKDLRDDYDERCLDKIVEEEKLTDAQRSLLRKPVHEFMVRSEVFLGSKHHDLADLVSKVGFAQDKQYRRIVGIVQPFGAGKTKTALMLSHGSIDTKNPKLQRVAFVVLPIRWTEEHVLLRKLEEVQDALFSAINQATVSAQEIQAFSDRCERLVKLALLSVAAIFGKCASKGWFHPRSAKDRMQFGILAITERSVVILEMAKWFEENVEEASELLRFNRLRTKVLSEVRVTSGLDLVFVIDEIQHLCGRCRGYCVHRPSASNDDDDMEELEFIDNWKGERSRRPAKGHIRCTDLFYQMCCLMVDWVGVEGAFVTCSTMFKTWAKMEDMGSPLNRDLLRRFTDTHWFSAADCKKLIRHYFDVTDQHLAALDLKQFSRPTFACDFVLELNSQLRMLPAPLNVSDWLTTAFKAAEKAAVRMIRDKVSALLRKGLLRQLIDKLVTCLRLSADVLPDSEYNINDAYKEKRWHSYTQLISHGILKLGSATGNADQVSIADPLAAKGILLCYDNLSECRAITETVVETTKLSELLAPHDKAHKGFTFEKVLAYLTARNLISLPKYAADGTVKFEPLESSVEFAAYYDELKSATDSLLLANEASFVSAIFSVQNLPGKLNCVYLPTKECGPDFVFRSKRMRNTQEVNVYVAVQSKVENVVYSFEKLKEALQSLDVARMFRTAAKEERTKWQEWRIAPHAEYLRIVFSALGFNNEAQHTVHEYNLQQARNSHPAFIHLLNLDDLREFLGPLYDKMKDTLSGAVQPNLVASNQMLAYDSAWRQANEKGMSNKVLENLCRSFGIEHLHKNKQQLMDGLNKHEQTLADRFQQLSLKLPVSV